jgi:hypothetical protein
MCGFHFRPWIMPCTGNSSGASRPTGTLFSRYLMASYLTWRSLVSNSPARYWAAIPRRPRAIPPGSSPCSAIQVSRNARSAAVGSPPAVPSVTDPESGPSGQFPGPAARPPAPVARRTHHHRRAEFPGYLTGVALLQKREVAVDLGQLLPGQSTAFASLAQRSSDRPVGESNAKGHSRRTCRSPPPAPERSSLQASARAVRRLSTEACNGEVEPADGRIWQSRDTRPWWLPIRARATAGHPITACRLRSCVWRRRASSAARTPER